MSIGETKNVLDVFTNRREEESGGRRSILLFDGGEDS